MNHIVKFVGTAFLLVMVAASFFLGRVSVGVVEPIKETVTVKTEVFLNKRIMDCEEKGGKYSLYWSLAEEYRETCVIQEQVLENF